MKTHFFGTPKLRLLFAVAFLALQAAPAAAADSAGSSTATIGRERPIAFSDVYVFRAECSFRAMIDVEVSRA